MTMERGDSPLAGRRPAPLSSVTSVSSIGSMGPLGSLPPLGSVHTPNSANPRGSLAPLPTLLSLNTLGGAGSGSTQSGDSSSTSFWRELKGVERWFDSLDSQERVAVVATLATRSSEQQLHQFGATIEKAINTPHTGSSTVSSAPSSQSASVAPNNSGGSAHTSNTSNASHNSASHPSAPHTAPAQSGGSNLSRFGVGQKLQLPSQESVYRYRSPLNTYDGSPTLGPSNGPGDSSGGSASSGDAKNAAGSASESIYSHAFLPLPRAQGFSPWGTEIRRPNSATADAWPDTARGSPTLANTSMESSPTLGKVPLEGSPVGLKPWRTFTPQQPIGSGISGSIGSGLGNLGGGIPLNSSQSGLGSGNGQERSLLYPLGSVYAQRYNSSSTNSLVKDSTSTPPGAPGAPGSAPASSGGVNSGSSHTGSAHSAPGSAPASSATPVSGSTNGPVSGSAASITAAHMSGNTPASTTTSVPASTSTNAQSSTYATNSAEASAAQASYSPPSQSQRMRRTVNVIDVELLSDIGTWLRSLRLHKYTGNLSGMHWQEVIQLTDQDLEYRGVNALGARRKLLKMFEEIRQAQEDGQLPE